MDRENGEIQVEVVAVVAKQSWVGVGFSDYGEMSGGDMCVMWLDWRHGLKLTDVSIDHNSLMQVGQKVYTLTEIRIESI